MRCAFTPNGAGSGVRSRFVDVLGVVGEVKFGVIGAVELDAAPVGTKGPAATRLF